MRNHCLPVLLLTLCAAASAQEPGLKKCRAVTDTAARLACYDALADAPPVAAAAPARAVAPAAAVAAAPAAAARPADSFGLPMSRAEEAQTVQSAVGARFNGWSPNRHIRLDNGQVWQVIDGTSVVLPEGARKVTVKRGLLGSFYLDFEGLNTSPRVKRVE